MNDPRYCHLCNCGNAPKKVLLKRYGRFWMHEDSERGKDCYVTQFVQLPDELPKK